jgi:7-keto-8-aminopelargonate synthetase-like enzyme
MPDLFRFAGNDYLGLATHPAVVEALCEAARTYGVSATSSRWAQGWTPLHENLERELRKWQGTEDACIFGAAYLGGAIYYGCMAAAGYRTVFCDETVHVNQFLGMRAAGLEIRKFRHLDVEDLRRLTAGYRGPPAIVATDGVYALSGEVAPVAGLAAAAASIGAALFVDDAHGVGVLGPNSRGVVEAAGLPPGAATVLGSFSKALGTGGGFLAGRRELVERFRRSPEASGSTIGSPALAAATLAALRILRTDPTPRRRLEANAAFMRRTLSEAGIGLVDTRHPILGMLLRDEPEASSLDAHFREHGIWIPYFKYASEPRHNLLRGAARAVYTDELLERFARAVRSRPGSSSRG